MIIEPLGVPFQKPMKSPAEPPGFFYIYIPSLPIYQGIPLILIDTIIRYLLYRLLSRFPRVNIL